MKKLFLNAAPVIAITFLLSACKGDVGPAGPQGPAGPTGATGATGAAGATGTANVIYSAWFQAAAWTGGGTQTGYFDKAAPGVTAAIRDNGVILGYAKLIGDGTNIRPLPATTTTGANIVLWNLFSPSVGNLRYTFLVENGGSLGPSGTNEFRYVLIPGGVAGGRFSSGPAAGYSVAQLKAMSYQELCTVFQIPENGSKEK